MPINKTRAHHRLSKLHRSRAIMPCVCKNAARLQEGVHSWEPLSKIGGGGQATKTDDQGQSRAAEPCLLFKKTYTESSSHERAAKKPGAT